MGSQLCARPENEYNPQQTSIHKAISLNLIILFVDPVFLLEDQGKYSRRNYLLQYRSVGIYIAMG